MKIQKKNRLKQITFRNLQSHLEYRHIKVYVLIRYTVCESLVKIEQFRYEINHVWNVLKETTKSRGVP